MEPVFSISESLSFGWQKFRQHSGLIFAVVVLILAFNIASRIVQAYSSRAPALGLVNLILFIISMVVDIGATIIVLKLSRDEPASFANIIPPWRLFWRSILSSLLLVLFFLAGGLVLFALGGGAFLAARSLFIPILVIGVAVGVIFFVWLAVRYSMIRFIAVDQHTMPAEGLGIVNILRQSAQMTVGARWQLVLFGIVLVAVNILGAIALLVGLLISIPITYFASTYVYLKLKARVQMTTTPTELVAPQN